MTSTQPETPVRHVADQQQFEAELDGQVAKACYQLDGELMSLTHTEVPQALEGRGVAAALIGAALDHARQQGWKVQPLCSYAAAYMQRHPETQDLMAR